MHVLGINAAYHDSAACLVTDGTVVAAAEEERFNRVKHGKRPVPFSAWELPFGAIDYCLSAGGLRLRDVDAVAYSYDPALFADLADMERRSFPMDPSGRSASDRDAGTSPWDPLFARFLLSAPRQLASGAPHHLRSRFEGVDPDSPPYTFAFVEHHLAHAASAFLPSPYGTSAVMTIDGRGERATTAYWRGEGSTLTKLGEVVMPDSLGLLYERFTTHLGFLHSSDEYKVMALASYGDPDAVPDVRQLVDVGDRGGYTVETGDLTRRFGPARGRGEPFEQRHFDIAASLQRALEEAVVALARWLRHETGSTELCMAGGVALNCVMNSRIRDAGIFDGVWVQPASGDSGTALGAAVWQYAVESERRGSLAPSRWRMSHAFLGPSYDDGDIRRFLDWSKLPYEASEDVAAEAARLLAADRLIGWFQGAMEFGPRALGARSILASPLSAGMKRRLNDLKDREDFRPVAPVVMAERASEWFDMDGPSPYMLFVNDVRDDKADRVPAIRHVDGSARVQTIDAAQHPRYHRLLSEFERITGVPVLVNTSFNTRGEPIVCSPRDAVECFWTSPLDDLVIGSFILHKTPVRRYEREADAFGLGSPGEFPITGPVSIEAAS